MADSPIVANVADSTVAGSPAPESLLSALDPAQREVAETVAGPVVVLAGAGTGKTRAITHRIAYAVATGVHDPNRSLALTFTTRAAGEMTRRLAVLGVGGIRVRTFHAAALRQLKWAWPQAIGGPMQELITSKAGLIASAAAANRVSSEPAMVRDLAGEIEWAKAMQVLPDDYPEFAAKYSRRAPGGVELDQVAAVYSGYERAKRNAGRIDFEDVLLLTIGVLDERRELLAQVRDSFRHFTVDEYQDVSGVQQRLLDLWLGDRDDVCVVGDVAQTIYSFAGADPAYLTQFSARFPDTTTVYLTRCYRCTPQIVDVAQRISFATRDAYSALQSQLPAGPVPKVREYADAPAEAAGVVREIAGLIASGISPGDIAVLVRINAATEPIESCLADAGIAYSIRGGRRFFERPEVRKAVTLLRGSALGSSTTDAADTRSAIRGVLATAGWTATPPSDTGATREAWESLAALVALGDEVCAANPNAMLSDVVAEIVRRDEAQDAPSVDGVTLASLHAAKGMEWQAVFLVGLVDGIMPMSYAATVEQIAEERRLLYVGATRAKKVLALSWARARTPGGRSRRPSRFLGPLLGSGPDDATGSSRPARSRRKDRKPAECRSCGKSLVTGTERTLGRCQTCPANANEVVLERLRQWRSDEVAALSAERGKQLPAYLVVTDATVQALAEGMPSNLDELAEIPGLGPAKLERFGTSLLALLEKPVD